MSVSEDLPHRKPLSVPAEMLTGRTEEHLCSSAEAQSIGVRVHRDVVSPFHELREEAARAGFDLRILSGFRSFDRQLEIWNGKAVGEIAVLDDEGRPLDITRLSARELAFAILRWSALPGASRHHWGTDLDVYDRTARPEGYEIELIPEEVGPEGMFGPLHAWLDSRIAAGAAFGFFRPYDEDRGGVAPERWHLSHAPTAAPCQRDLTARVLRSTLEGAEIRLKDVILRYLDEIYERFVANTGSPPV